MLFPPADSANLSYCDDSITHDLKLNYRPEKNSQAGKDNSRELKVKQVKCWTDNTLNDFFAFFVCLFYLSEFKCSFSSVSVSRLNM